MKEGEDEVFIYLPLKKKNIEGKLQVHRLSPLAKLPKRGSEGAAGYDLFAASSMILSPWSKGCVNIDISIILPKGVYGRIAGRSGLALKGITVAGGVIDPDYRGNLGVILYNFSDEEFKINPGDRIAQLILEKFEVPEVVEISSLENDLSSRGDKGFGSTGTN